MVIKITIKKSALPVSTIYLYCPESLVFQYELGFPYINCNAKSYLESFEYPDNTS